jgi:broad specificity phosphatase PhoE
MKIYQVISTRWIHGDLDYDDSRFESWHKFKQRVAAVIPHIIENSAKAKSTMVVSSGGPISVSIGHILGLSDEKILHLSWVINNASISELIFSQHRVSLKNFNTIPHLQEAELITLV